MNERREEGSGVGGERGMDIWMWGCECVCWEAECEEWGRRKIVARDVRSREG